VFLASFNLVLLQSSGAWFGSQSLHLTNNETDRWRDLMFPLVVLGDFNEMQTVIFRADQPEPTHYTLYNVVIYFSEI